MQKKQIIVLGAGFGGLRFTLILDKKLRKLKLDSRYEILLIDRNEYHTFTPLLYKVATTSKEYASLNELYNLIAYSVKKLLYHRNARFLKEEIALVDPEKKQLITRNGEKIRADYIIFAPGLEVNYFNIPGLKNYALPFKTFFDAMRVRETIVALLEEPDAIEIIIGGGGSTGIELAAELTSWCKNLETMLPLCRVRISIIEASPTILNGFDRRVIEKAIARLNKLGVNIIVKDAILKVEKKSITLASGKKVGFDILIWTGGVKASSLLQVPKSDLNSSEKKDSYKLTPQKDLSIFPGIYALGDAVSFYSPVTNRPIPGIARTALLQADIAAHNLLQDIKRESGITNAEPHKSFRSWNYPYVIPVGGLYTIAKIGPVVFSGFFGWVFKYLIELNYFCSIMKPHQAFLLWIKGVRVFSKNDRVGREKN